MVPILVGFAREKKTSNIVFVNRFENILTCADAMSLFRSEFPDALGLIGEDRLRREFFAHPPSPLLTIKVSWREGEREAEGPSQPDIRHAKFVIVFT